MNSVCKAYDVGLQFLRRLPRCLDDIFRFDFQLLLHFFDDFRLIQVQIAIGLKKHPLAFDRDFHHVMISGLTGRYLRGGMVESEGGTFLPVLRTARERERRGI